jgi:hypothetical protein
MRERARYGCQGIVYESVKVSGREDLTTVNRHDRVCPPKQGYSNQLNHVGHLDEVMRSSNASCQREAAQVRSTVKKEHIHAECDSLDSLLTNQLCRPQIQRSAYIIINTVVADLV